MLMTISKAALCLSFAASALTSPIERRSIPAMQGWSWPNFNGTLEYETFCTPGQCCFASKSDAEGNPQPVVVAVGSLNLADANVLLKNTSTVSIWDAWDCSGSAIKTFNAFNGDANLGTPTIVGGFTFFTN